MVATQVLSPTPTMPAIRRPLPRAAAVVGLLGAVVSMTGSWIPSLWGDEAASVLSARRPLLSLFGMLGHVDAVHGLSYVMLHFWIRVFGTSVFAMRLPSAIAIGICAAAVVVLCARFGTIRFAMVAGAIAAILPRLTLAGAEVRAYAWDAAFAAVLCVILARLVSDPRPGRRWWIAYTAVLAVGTYAFLYVALMGLAAGAAILLSRPRRALACSWAVATVAALVLAAPVIVAGVLERHQISYLSHRTVVTPSSMLVSMWFGSIPVAVIGWGLIVVAAVGWARDARDALRRARPLPVLEPIALSWLLLPVGLLLLVNLVSSGFTPRYGTFAAPGAAVLMAVGIRRVLRASRRAGVRGPWAAVGLVAALVVAIAPVWASQRGPYSENQSDWNDIAATIRTQAHPGDGIVFDEGTRPSRRTRLAMDTDPAAFVAVRDIALKVPYARETTWHSTAYTVAQAAARGRLNGIDRVWVVEYATPGLVDTWGVTDLRALGFRRTETVRHHRSVVALYVR